MRRESNWLLQWNRDQTKYPAKASDMNPSSKFLKQQTRKTRTALSGDLGKITEMLNVAQQTDIIEPYLESTRNTSYNPTTTLSMFLHQALSSDPSCQNVVDQAALMDPSLSVGTGAYCCAIFS